MDEIGAIRELVTQLRALKAERNLSNNKQVEFFHLSDEQGTKTIEVNEAAILSMVGIAKLKNVDSAPAGLPATVTPWALFSRSECRGGFGIGTQAPDEGSSIT